MLADLRDWGMWQYNDIKTYNLHIRSASKPELFRSKTLIWKTAQTLNSNLFSHVKTVLARLMEISKNGQPGQIVTECAMAA